MYLSRYSLSFPLIVPDKASIMIYLPHRLPFLLFSFLYVNFEPNFLKQYVKEFVYR